MKKGIAFVTAAAAVLALAGTVLASQAATTTTKPKAPMTASAVGTIAKYDAATRTLTLSTTKGEQTFVLASAATIHQGSKTLQADAIASQSGQRAKVRYSQVNGQKTADTVMILSATSMASAQKPASKPSK